MARGFTENIGCKNKNCRNGIEKWHRKNHQNNQKIFENSKEALYETLSSTTPEEEKIKTLSNELKRLYEKGRNLLATEKQTELVSTR